jgi:hypothetical protein
MKFKAIGIIDINPRSRNPSGAGILPVVGVADLFLPGRENSNS